MTGTLLIIIINFFKNLNHNFINLIINFINNVT